MASHGLTVIKNVLERKKEKLHGIRNQIPGQVLL
jgi:hypothetical protein